MVDSIGLAVHLIATVHLFAVSEFVVSCSATHLLLQWAASSQSCWAASRCSQVCEQGTRVCTGCHPSFPTFSYPRIAHSIMHATPAWLAGKDFVHQLNMVCKVIGTPTAAEIAAVPSDQARAYLASMPYFPKGGAHAHVGSGQLGFLCLKLVPPKLVVRCLKVLLSLLAWLPCRHAAVLPQRQCAGHRPARPAAHI